MPVYVGGVKTDIFRRNMTSEFSGCFILIEHFFEFNMTHADVFLARFFFNGRYCTARTDHEAVGALMAVIAAVAAIPENLRTFFQINIIHRAVVHTQSALRVQAFLRISYKNTLRIRRAEQHI